MYMSIANTHNFRNSPADFMRFSATALRILMIRLDEQAQTGHLDPCRSYLPLILPHQRLNPGIIRTGCGKGGAGTRETGRIVGDKVAERAAEPNYRKPWRLPA